MARAGTSVDGSRNRGSRRKAMVTHGRRGRKEQFEEWRTPGRWDPAWNRRRGERRGHDPVPQVRRDELPVPPGLAPRARRASPRSHLLGVPPRLHDVRTGERREGATCPGCGRVACNLAVLHTAPGRGLERKWGGRKKVVRVSTNWDDRCRWTWYLFERVCVSRHTSESRQGAGPAGTHAPETNATQGRAKDRCRSIHPSLPTPWTPP